MIERVRSVEVAGALLILFLAVVGALPAMAASPAKATIAVVPFEVAAGVDAKGLQSTNVLTDVFTRTLVNTRKFTVVDRSRLTTVWREQKLGRSEVVEPRTAARIGRLLGAQYLVIGSLTDLAALPPYEMAYDSGWAQTVRLGVEVTIVDSDTAEIVAARKAASTIQVRTGGPEAAEEIPRDVLASVAEDVAQQAIHAVVDVAYPVKVVEVGAEGVWLNRGEGGGLQIGDVLECYGAGRRLVDPDTKEALGGGQTALGSVRVAQMDAKATLAEVVEDHGIAAGNTCRVADNGAHEAGSHHAPPPDGAIHAY